ncbi:hypothetical protein EV424DRAFT_1350598 [Suillus variegatus]|nr:hypothetical protein EV424DRAFT_1350598 [Suillus variegatus]
MPIIKYPYLPLSEQIKSLLKIPGLEAVLDGWRSKPCTISKYTDIFDGDTCRTKLKGPDDKLQAFQQGAFRPWTNEEQRELGKRYRRLTTTSARKNFVKEHATRYTQLSRLPYFNLVKQIVIDTMHNLYLGLVKTHFYNIWVQGKILRANHKLDIFHDMLADVRLDLMCGSLTADQWLLLATVYGPIIIPQLWSSCLPTDMDDEILCQHVTMIKKAEADKEADVKSKAEQKATLAAAKKQGKDTLKAEKARIAHEKLALSETKKQEKLRLAAAKQAEKVRIAAEKKVKAAAKKASKKCQATSQIVEDLPEGQVWPPPPPPSCLLPTSELLTEPAADAAGEEEAKFLLHPDDPANFLKLCAALRILSKRSLCDQDLYGSGSVKPNHHFATHVGACVRNFGPLHDFWTFLFKRLNKLLKSYKTNNHLNGALKTTFFMEFHRTCELGRLTYTLQHYPKDSLPSQTASITLKASNDERGTVAGLAALSKDLDNAGADVFFDYVMIDTVGTNHSSLVHVIIPGTSVIHAYGKVLEIFHFNQRFSNVDDSLWFSRMHWFVPWRGECEKVWDDFYSADVRLWQLGEYKSRETQLPSLINPD